LRQKDVFLVSVPSLDPSALPEIMTPPQLGAALGKSVDQLAHERCMRQGPAYVKYGSKVYYLRADVIAFLEANRRDPHIGGADR
jgi:hypothetical protein